MNHAEQKGPARPCYLGVELGSTRIKAVTIDARYAPASSGEYTWTSSYENGIWTYSLEEAWKGLKTALGAVDGRDAVTAAGISAMMHGYLAFDRDWNLLTPFRTWQNTTTGPAAAELTALFGFNIPQRWSIAHLYQAVLNGEPHVAEIAHITTLAGFVHYKLTGVNAIGTGEASGMFPVDSGTLDYNQRMVEQFDRLVAPGGFAWKLRDILPGVLAAGERAGTLTEEGAALLDGLLPSGIPFAPPEGDAGTGMTASNAVAARTGNVSAGTSIFSMVVLERPLERVHEEIDLVATPAGKPVAMVHCNNCTGDSNAWVSVLREAAELFGASPDPGEIYARLYRKSLEGDPDCGGIFVCNYLAGEGVTHMDAGRPMVVRYPGSRFNLANFFRAQLYAAMATLRIGMDILAEEHASADSLTGHGGLFKTPEVGQRYLSAACNAPVTCMDTAGEGGPWGMALLAAYMAERSGGEQLEDYLAEKVFAGVRRMTWKPEAEDMAGFNVFLDRYKAGLAVERAALKALKEGEE